MSGPNPKELARETVRTLEKLADPKKAESSRRFFKEPIHPLGVDAPALHRVEKEVYARVKKEWSADDAIRFCDALLRESHEEPRLLGYLVVGKFANELTPAHLPRIRRWLDRSCTNWAAVDTLAPSVLSRLLDNHPEVIPQIAAWTEDRNLWVRRAAPVSFVLHARKGKHLAMAYRIAERLFDDTEDLMHKAVGWLLREAGKTDMPRLERFLLKHGPRIPRTTLRYAIERFPEKKRKALLVRTRG